MSRRLSHSLRHPLAVMFVLVVTSCGGASAEQQLLANFFRASRVRDNATLSNISTVQFNPRTDGTVQDFKVTSVGDEQRRTLQIQQAMDEADKAKTAEGEFTKRKRAYQDDNVETLLRISANQREKKPIAGKDSAVLDAW